MGNAKAVTVLGERVKYGRAIQILRFDDKVVKGGISMEERRPGKARQPRSLTWARVAGTVAEATNGRFAFFWQSHWPLSRDDILRGVA